MRSEQQVKHLPQRPALDTDGQADRSFVSELYGLG